MVKKLSSVIAVLLILAFMEKTVYFDPFEIEGNPMDAEHSYKILLEIMENICYNAQKCRNKGIIGYREELTYAQNKTICKSN